MFTTDTLEKLIFKLYNQKLQYVEIQFENVRGFGLIKQVMVEFKNWTKNYYDEQLKINRFNNLQFNKFVIDLIKKYRLTNNLKTLNELKAAIFTACKTAKCISIKPLNQIFYVLDVLS